jgi:hypothetical protein
MVFGFNTDIRQDETVYHVQSEVRQNERCLQTQIFVRGRCIGKHATSIADVGDSEQELHQRLRLQHREALDAIREGRLESFLAEPQIKLEWIDAQARQDQNVMVLRFRVNQSPAHVAAWADSMTDRPAGCESDASPDGEVELTLPLAPQPDVIIIQVKAANHTLTQRFRLHRR